MDKLEVENTFKFIHTENPNEALEKAFGIAGRDVEILVVPQGTTTLLEPTQ